MKTVYVDGVPISVRQRVPRAVRQHNVPSKRFDSYNNYEGVKTGYKTAKTGITKIGNFLKPEARLQRMKDELKNRRKAESLQMEEHHLKTELEEQRARDRVNRPGIAQKASGLIGGLFKKKKENIYSRNSGGWWFLNNKGGIAGLLKDGLELALCSYLYILISPVVLDNLLFPQLAANPTTENVAIRLILQLVGLLIVVGGVIIMINRINRPEQPPYQPQYPQQYPGY